MESSIIRHWEYNCNNMHSLQSSVCGKLRMYNMLYVCNVSMYTSAVVRGQCYITFYVCRASGIEWDRVYILHIYRYVCCKVWSNVCVHWPVWQLHSAVWGRRSWAVGREVGAWELPFPSTTPLLSPHCTALATLPCYALTLQFWKGLCCNPSWVGLKQNHREMFLLYRCGLWQQLLE